MVLRIIIVLVVIGFTWSLLYIKPNAKRIIKSPFLPNTYLDGELKYQVITLLLAFLTLSLVFIVSPTSFQKYFSIGNISAPVVPVPALGITPTPNETWLNLGINFAIIISLVTFVIIYLQLIRDKKISRENWRFFYWVVIFALMNSFTEEMITRFSVVALLDSIIPLSYIYLVSAFIFGTVHYFGTPGKIPGVLLAGFLGWFLAKSIGETQGIFWAWIIHFLQDVVIFTGLFFQQFATNKQNG